MTILDRTRLTDLLTKKELNLSTLFLLTFLKESKQRTFVQNFVLLPCVELEHLLWLNDNGASVVKNANLLRMREVKFLVKLFS